MSVQSILAGCRPVESSRWVFKSVRGIWRRGIMEVKDIISKPSTPLLLSLVTHTGMVPRVWTAEAIALFEFYLEVRARGEFPFPYSEMAEQLAEKTGGEWTVAQLRSKATQLRRKAAAKAAATAPTATIVANEVTKSQD
ncbi:MAG: hypothetical protein M1829_002611 [Trizodia sp. TS-e1964]|nr:MAG: hypothetical protein M1829_002611 [Trizodia sp. TS-e1964]